MEIVVMKNLSHLTNSIATTLLQECIHAGNASCNDTSTLPPPSPPSKGGPSMEHRFWMDGVIGLTLGILGILGNFLALVVLSRQKPRVTTTVVLMVLAVMDNLVLISRVLLNSLRYLALYTGTMQAYLSAYPQLFLILYPWVYTFRLLDMWLTVLLTVDRYIVVCRPLHASTVCTVRRAVRDILIIATCSVLFSSPRFFEHQKSQDSPYGFETTDLLESKTYTVAYRIFAFFMLQYVIPLALMIFLNAQLLISLWKAMAKRAVYQKQSSRARSSSSGTNATRSVTIIVVIVVLICVMTNSLALIAQLLWSLEKCWPVAMASVNPYRRYISAYSNMAVTINSASNLPIYYLCSKRFRKLVKDTFLHACRRKKQPNFVAYQRRSPQAMYLQTNGHSSSCTTKTCRFNTNYISMSSMKRIKPPETPQMKYN